MKIRKLFFWITLCLVIFAFGFGITITIASIMDRQSEAFIQTGKVPDEKFRRAFYDDLRRKEK